MHCRTSLPAAALVAFIAMGMSACGGADETNDTAGTAEGDCTPAHDFPTVTEGTLTVSVYVTPPYTSLDNSDLGGVDGTLVSRIAEMECLELDASSVTAAALIESVTSGRADVAIGGVYRTAERAEILALTDTVYRDGMALLSEEGVSTIEELEGKSVGVIQGYLWNEDLQEVLGADNVRLYQASDGMLNDLVNGRVDVGVLTSAEAGYRAEQRPEANLQAVEVEPDERIAASQEPGQVVFAHTLGNTAMTEAFNADIAALLEEDVVADVLSENGMDPSLAGPGAP